jgi:hypothetical protein
MDPKELAKRISLYESGLISAPEWANSLLLDLVSAPEFDTAFVSSLDSLPREVGQAFRSLLARIEEANFRWTPFLLTSSTDPRDPTEYSTQLRQVCALLAQGRASNGEQRQTDPGSRKTAGARKASAD